MAFNLTRYSSVPALAGCESAQGTRFGWIGLGDRMDMGSSRSAMAGPRPGAKSGLGDFFTPFPLLPPVASPQHSTTPLLHYSLSPKFPATFPAAFLCMEWRPAASPRKRCSGKKRIWIRTINTEACGRICGSKWRSARGRRAHQLWPDCGVASYNHHETTHHHCVWGTAVISYRLRHCKNS